MEEKCIDTTFAPLGQTLESIKRSIDESKKEKATDKQVGGDHYKMAIQPVEFIMKNNLDFCTGNCIKYLCRHRQKNGIEDLEKAKHYIDLLIEMEYPMGNNGVRFNPINKEESNTKLL